VVLKVWLEGYQRNFAEWIKRSESTKKRKVSRFKLVAGWKDFLIAGMFQGDNSMKKTYYGFKR